MKYTFLASVLIALSGNALAFKLPLGHAGADLSKLPKAARSALFEGIIKLNNCSGSLIILEGQSQNSKAFVMTNGHCVDNNGGFLAPGEVWTNRASQRRMQVFNRNMQLSAVTAEKLVYATMTSTDVAIYQLNTTYADITNRTGARPLLLAPTRPTERIAINIPSGYWDRNWKCEIDGFVFAIREDAYTFSDSIRYNANCDTIGGTSGSPLVEHGTRTVVGINNTSNESGARCTMNNPCEVDRAGNVTVIRNRSYGQQTYQLYGCFNERFELDLNLSSCELPKP